MDDEASGPSYTVPALARSLCEIGHEVELLSLGAPSQQRAGGLIHTRFRPDFDAIPIVSKLGICAAMHARLQTSSAEVLHTHGLWMMPNIYPAVAATRTDRPLVLSPRGMLSPGALRFSRARKALFWCVLQKRAAETVSCFHATCEEEHQDIRLAGLRQPVAIIPNGIEVLTGTSRRMADAADGHLVLSLGRIHPKKGLDQLIRAWARISPEFPKWRLDIVGPDEGGYARALNNLIAQLDVRRVTVRGPVFGAEKQELLSRADIFAFPTLSENFGMVVAESLASGTPVISTKGAPWAGLVVHRCGWWIDHGEAAMAAALRNAMTLSPKKRRAMGERGRAWVQRDLAWGSIAHQMSAVYHWLVHAGAKPDWVSA